MIRWATPEDAALLADVFFRSVREGDSPYTQAQRIAWMPKAPETGPFAQRLAKKECVLKEVDGEPVGFMTVEPGGYVDLAFILPQYRGQGIFRALYEAIEDRARDTGERRLHTHASLMAEPAFRTVGFRVIQRETVERAGEFLRRAEMEKVLT